MSAKPWHTLRQVLGDKLADEVLDAAHKISPQPTGELVLATAIMILHIRVRALENEHVCPNGGSHAFFYEYRDTGAQELCSKCGLHRGVR